MAYDKGRTQDGTGKSLPTGATMPASSGQSAQRPYEQLSAEGKKLVDTVLAIKEEIDSAEIRRASTDRAEVERVLKKIGYKGPARS